MNASVNLIGQVVGATVGLKARIPETHPSVSILGNERTGTGVLIDARGLVLTVNYVVLGADDIEIALIDGESYPGRVVAQDFASGIAVVKIERKSPFPAAALRSSTSATVGQEVFVIASVGGADRRASNGAITSLKAFDAYWEYSLERAILTSAVNPGFGGAPLFDLLGKVIGIVSLDLNEIGRFTMAIPVEHYIDHREELQRFGRRVSDPARAWVGFYCYNHQEHVVIAGVLPGGPAEAAGLKPGDVVLALNDQKISGRGELYACLWAHRPGEQLSFRVFRESGVETVTVATGSVDKYFA